MNRLKKLLTKAVEELKLYQENLETDDTFQSEAAELLKLIHNIEYELDAQDAK